MAPLRVPRRCGGLLAVWAKRTPPELGSGRRFTMVRSMWRSRWRARDRPVLRPGQLPCPRCGLRESGPARRWPLATRAPLGPGRSRGPGPPGPAIPRKAWCSARALVSGQDRIGACHPARRPDARPLILLPRPVRAADQCPAIRYRPAGEQAQAAGMGEGSGVRGASDGSVAPTVAQDRAEYAETALCSNRGPTFGPIDIRMPAVARPNIEIDMYPVCAPLPVRLKIFSFPRGSSRGFQAVVRLREILKFFVGGLCETMSAFRLIMSAYHPASDVSGWVAE